MKVNTQEITTINAYIKAQPKERQEGLKELRDIIRKAAPDAEEGISYKMPTFKLGGILACFAAYKKHFGLYAMPSAVVYFKEELKNYVTSKGTIQFPIDKPLPSALIKKIILFRVKENKMKAALKAKEKK
jgi:uncharacterized protein YdhG (YjbR/CyaY superfamily)